VGVFAGFLLVHIVVDNFVEQYGDPAGRDSVSRVSTAWARATGSVQGWTLFTPPIARVGGFPAVEIVFSDGSRELVLSDNEPADRTSFFRAGRLRLRRLEDYLLSNASTPAGAAEEPLVTPYVRRRVAHWKSLNPLDRRTPVRGLLLERKYTFTEPGTTDTPPGPPAIRVLHICDLRGAEP